MEKTVFLSMFLDTRRAKDNGRFPVKLRVYNKPFKKAKLYPTAFEYTEKEFQSIWETTKPRKEFQERKRELQAVETKAHETLNQLNPFTFEQFEKKLFRNDGEQVNIYYQYALIIKRLKGNEQIGTASNYEQSLKSIQGFVKFNTGKEPKSLSFYEITPGWLNKYEQYMLNSIGRSRTTVSIYLRALRTVFNTAISEKEIEAEIYPFGEKKYQVPAVKNVKKALGKEHLKTLFDALPLTKEQAKAKDFWFFSYACNGMNIKDIALLRWEDLQDEKLTFYRAKTINTGKADLRPVTVYLNDFSKAVIEKYGNVNREPKGLIFSIIEKEQDESTRYKRIKNFTRFINQNLKLLAVSNGITGEISTYWARHSFATKLIRGGAPIAFVSEALNHSNIKTTQIYFAGFEDSSKKELMKDLMNF
jgi:integrase/recombinase XerD